ncbi:MAG: Long-chain-fatty-acid--CoA ligase FadD13 [Solirubrobacterales bacterium]|nr:Long-chain-fatty-acid--CoA ligase FadD13 [Solirubrobacterales bacterium]
MLGNVFTVLDRIAGSARRHDPAVIFDGVPRSFTELRERSLRAANALHGIGVQPGDRVAVLLPNGHEWTELFFGTAALGAICVPVNVLNSGPDVLDVLEDCGATTLVVAATADEKLGDIDRDQLPERVIAVGPSALAQTQDYEALLAKSSTAVPHGPAQHDLFMFFYSSGTTGKPKAAAHTHTGILWNSFQQLVDFGLTAQDRYLAVPSLSWAAGFHNLILPLWWQGGTTVLMPTGGTTVDRIVAGVHTGNCTHTFLVPTLLKQLLTSPEQLEILRGTDLRWIISGAEPVPVSVIEQLNAELPGCDVVQGYGMSEFPTIATALRPEEAIPKAGSAGRPMSITQLAVRHGDGTIAATGDGEVLLRSLASMQEYYGRPGATRDAFADGWLNTGDVGSVDDEGYLTITGRTKDMIISGGLNIYPKEIEDVIYRLEGVAEAAVIGVQDDVWGEIVVAVVVPEAGGTVSEDQVQAACEVLGKYKRPKAVFLRDEPLPRTLTQKVLKRELRPWAQDQVSGSGSGTGGAR